MYVFRHVRRPIASGVLGISFACALIVWTGVGVGMVLWAWCLLQVDPEPPAVIENRTPDATWPQHGAVRFENFSLRYREHLPLVLKDVSVTIEPRQKVCCCCYCWW